MDKTQLQITVGNNLRIIRKQHGLTQEEFAEKIDISPSFCANVERGNKSISIDVLYKISECFNVSADSIIYENSGDTSIKNIELLLKDKPYSFISSIEKMIRFCIDDFYEKE